MSEQLPLLPYAGSSGWSGSDTSRERADRDDSTGKTTKRQREILRYLRRRENIGTTWKELADWYGWHHGQASGSLSNLHKGGLIVRLKDTRRDRCAVYVLPEYAGGREVAAQGRTRPGLAGNPKAAELVEDAFNAVTQWFLSSAASGSQIDVIRDDLLRDLDGLR